MQKANRHLLILFTVLFSSVSFSQNKVDSPFARYGIGNPDPLGTFRTQAMGGISSGIRNNITINYLTPASFSSFDTASFVVDIGLDYNIYKLKDAESKYVSADANFTHLIMGFPLMKNWGVSFGLVPVSNGYYEIAKTTNPDPSGEDIAGDVYEVHQGIGGYQRFYLGTGISPFKYMSLGADFFVLFGEINRQNEFIFTTDNNYFNMRDLQDNAIRGIGFDLSMQLMFPLRNEWFINGGLTLTPGKNYKTINDHLIIRYAGVQTSALAFDTLLVDTSDTTSYLPSTWRGGISFGRENKFTFGLDLVYTKWSEASLPGNYGTYTDAISLHAGAEFIPDKYSNYSFFDRIEYRMGCRYGQSYALYEGDQLNEYGITFGVGLPLRRSRSRASLVIDLSSRGNADNNLFRETKIVIGASLNLFDFWFLKAKYD